jgi:hypothetical protein
LSLQFLIKLRHNSLMGSSGGLLCLKGLDFKDFNIKIPVIKLFYGHISLDDYKMILENHEKRLIFCKMFKLQFVIFLIFHPKQICFWPSLFLVFWIVWFHSQYSAWRMSNLNDVQYNQYNIGRRGCALVSSLPKANWNRQAARQPGGRA